MERLTRKRSILFSIDLWTWLEKTGDQHKSNWPEWERNGGTYPEISADCFLCEYDERQDEASCEACPYYQGYNSCLDLDSPFYLWGKAHSISTRKEYASLFLEQLKTLLIHKEKGGD